MLASWDRWIRGLEAKQKELKKPIADDVDRLGLIKEMQQMLSNGGMSLNEWYRILMISFVMENFTAEELKEMYSDLKDCVSYLFRADLKWSRIIQQRLGSKKRSSSIKKQNRSLGIS